MHSNTGMSTRFAPIGNGSKQMEKNLQILEKANAL